MGSSPDQPRLNAQAALVAILRLALLAADASDLVKRVQLRLEIRSTVQTLSELTESETAAQIIRADESAARVFTACLTAMRELDVKLTAAGRVSVIVAVTTGLAWSRPKMKVALDESAIALAVQEVDARFTADVVAQVRKHHRKHMARLLRSSISKGAKVGLMAGSLAVAVLTAGVAAPAIGSAIGAAAGLSGAAATSFGLAALGGGSLASGGLGMAGGIALTKLGGAVVYKGSSFVLTGMAKQSRTAVAHQLAVMHVSLLLGAPSVYEVSTVLGRLAEIHGDMVVQSQESEERRRALWQASSKDYARLGEIGKEINRLAAARRMVEAQTKILQSRRSALVSDVAAFVPWGSVKDLGSILT